MRTSLSFLYPNALMSPLTSRFSLIVSTFGVPNPKTINITLQIPSLGATIYQDDAILLIISNSLDLLHVAPSVQTGSSTHENLRSFAQLRSGFPVRFSILGEPISGGVLTQGL
jgi:hypothetical protein